MLGLPSARTQLAVIDLTGDTVEEQSSGSIGASVGYAQDAGLILGANLQQNNFLGTGKQVGIGLTLLPVLYERAGFTQPHLRADQRRFATTVDEVIAMRDEIRAWRLPGVDAGVAIHSLRAARGESITELARRCADDPGPVHIHIAEQTGEVEDCLAATGQRPMRMRRLSTGNREADNGCRGNCEGAEGVPTQTGEQGAGPP